MKTRFVENSQLQISIAMAGLCLAVAAGCSPIVPSVPKLANSSAGKTTPTDGLFPGASLTAPMSNALSTSAASPLLAAAPSQSTRVLDEEAYGAEIVTRMANTGRHLHFIELEPGAVSRLKDDSRLAKPVSFSTSDTKLAGREALILASKRVKKTIYFLTNVAAEKIEGADTIHAVLSFVPAKDNEIEGRWFVAIESPSMKTGDFMDISAQKTRESLRAHLSGIVVVIDHQTKNGPVETVE